jgi:CRISPR-associated protein Csx3
MGRYAEAAAILREGWITRYACSQADHPGITTFSEAHREAAEKSWFEQDQNIARTLADLRNDIEHAGFRPNPRSPQTIKEQLESMMSQWRALDEPAPELQSIATNDQRNSMSVVYYSIGVDQPITPDEPLPPLPDIPRGALVVIEGRAPIWRYGLAFHRLHGSPAAAVAVYDPRLGAVVVATHSPQFADGQIIDLPPPPADRSGPR